MNREELEEVRRKDSILMEYLEKIGAMCFNCSYWSGEIKKEKGYCHKWHCSGKKHAPSGTHLCVAWSKRKNARLKPCN